MRLLGMMKEMSDGSQKNAQRRERILSAATRLFGCYGASKTTIADIAREADVSVGAVYLDFASKEAVLGELSGHQHEALYAETEAAVRAARGLAAQLEAWICTRTRWLCQRAGEAAHGCDLLHGCHEPVKNAREKYAERELALVVEILAAAKKRDEYTHSSSPKEMARVLLDACTSLLPPHLERDEKVATRRARRIAELVTVGLLTRD